MSWLPKQKFLIAILVEKLGKFCPENMHKCRVNFKSYIYQHNLSIHLVLFLTKFYLWRPDQRVGFFLLLSTIHCSDSKCCTWDKFWRPTAFPSDHSAFVCSSANPIKGYVWPATALVFCTWARIKHTLHDRTDQPAWDQQTRGTYSGLWEPSRRTSRLGSTGRSGKRS